MIGFRGGLFLLDIEGTLAPLAYVHEVLFPYARDRVGHFLQAAGTDPAVAEALRQMARDAGHEETRAWCPHPAGSGAATGWIADEARRLMDLDAKQTGLKQLQGLIWEAGFVRHELKSVIYPDVPAALEYWVARGKEVRIYSSGSIHAQKLFSGIPRAAIWAVSLAATMTRPPVQNARPRVMRKSRWRPGACREISCS